MLEHLQARLHAAFAEERRRGFEGLAGSHVHATVPVRQVLVDTALAESRWPAPLETVGVRILADNVLAVSAEVRVFGFTTPLRLRVHVSPSTPDGIVDAALDEGSLVARALSWLAPVFATLPRGVRIDGTRMRLDSKLLLSDLGLADVASMVTVTSVTTEDGVAWVSFEGAAPATAAPGHVRSSGDRPPALSAEALVGWLAGAHIDGEVRVSERLANMLVAEAHMAAKDARATAANDGTTGVSVRDAAIDAVAQPPVIRFEAGALVVSGAARLGAERTSPRDREPPQEP